MQLTKVRWGIVAAGCAALLGLAGVWILAGSRGIAQAAAGGTVPALGHVLIVVGENAGYSQTYGSMPYLDSLAAKYGLATNYVADTHPSIGNYFALSSGQILSNNDSLTPSQQTFSVDNIALDVQNAGKTWKDYVEEDPNASGCGALVSGSYYYRHDPLEYYSNITSSNIVCFSQFATDLANHALPNLSWLVPDGYDDGHDSSPSAFDSWLQTELAPLLSSSYFQPGGDGLLVVTFDEDSNTGSSGCSTSQIESGTWCGGQVETVVISPAIVSAGYQSSNGYHEESILRLMEEALGLSNFPGASANPNGALSPPIDMADFFAQGTTSGTVSLAPASLTFASQTVGTTSAAQVLTLTNGTNATLSISGVSITGTNSGDFVEVNTCGTSVAAAGTCTISVTFTPSTTSAVSATLSVSDSAGTQTASLSGTGASSSAPAASLSPASLTFASQTVGTTSAGQSVTLSNTGNASLSISGIALTGAGAADFAETNTCGSSVAAGGNCAIGVTFTPAASGTLTASLQVSDNAGGSPQAIPLSGTGAASSGGGGGTSSTDFVISSSPMSATVSAGASASYTITVAPQSGTGFSSAVALSCSGLPTLASCAFSPASVTPASGAVNSTLTISTTAASIAAPPSPPRTPKVPLPLAGLGAVLALSLLAFCARKSRRRLGFALAASVLLIGLVLPLASCGGGGAPRNPGTPAGTYNVQVTAQSGQLQHSLDVTLVVQ